MAIEQNTSVQVLPSPEDLAKDLRLPDEWLAIHRVKSSSPEYTEKYQQMVKEYHQELADLRAAMRASGDKFRASIRAMTIAALTT